MIDLRRGGGDRGRGASGHRRAAAQVLPVADHELLDGDERLVSDIVVLVVHEVHDARLGANIRDDLLAARVDADVLANVVAGDGEVQRIGRVVEDLGEQAQDLIVILIQIGRVELPERVRAVHRRPLEVARPHLRRVLVKRAQRLHVALQRMQQKVNVGGDVLVSKLAGGENVAQRQKLVVGHRAKINRRRLLEHVLRAKE